jgi:hypothetical protein
MTAFRKQQFQHWSKPNLLKSPLFKPLHPLLNRLACERFPTLHDCNALLGACQPPVTLQSGLPLRFVAQALGKLAFDSQYEPRCYLKGEVQTRENNWHDLLNALVWLTFPKTKSVINARHYLSMTNELLKTSSQRGAVRDMNTLFDESGVIVVSSNTELIALLLNFQWKQLFWARRKQVETEMDFYLFGHGLYEKAVSPYVGLTGQGIVREVPPAFFSWPLSERLVYLDELLANYLSLPENCRSTRELTPVPVLGVPGWVIDNDQPEYYDNISYFRPGRHR